VGRGVCHADDDQPEAFQAARDRVMRGMATRRSDSVRAAARDFWQLPDDALDQLLTLSGEADRVELKLTVPGLAHDAACAALGDDFARVRADRVHYLDTEDRMLDRQGVVVRVRSIAPVTAAAAVA
jgi:hypothetical protein